MYSHLRRYYSSDILVPGISKIIYPGIHNAKQ